MAQKHTSTGGLNLIADSPIMTSSGYPFRYDSLLMHTRIKPTFCYALAGILWASSLLTISSPAQANSTFYKCINDNGHTTYNDQPCAENESTRLISKQATPIAALDCHIAEDFMLDTVSRWQQGASRQDIFDAHGGAKNLANEILNMINFIYAFEGRSKGIDQILSSTKARCEAGLFGIRVELCETYPDTFVERYGSCAPAGKTDAVIATKNQ